MKQHRYYVRLSPHLPVFEWVPSRSDARVAELLHLIRQSGAVEDSSLLDLVDEVTGQPVDPDMMAEALRNHTLVATSQFVRRALRELRIYAAQTGSMVQCEHLPGSPLIRIELRYPALVQKPTLERGSLLIQGRHQALILLPLTYPQDAPRIFWTTPVFNPYLKENEEVWPPEYAWEEAPNLVSLIGALAETLLGLRPLKERRLVFRSKRRLNPKAAAWFHRHKKAVLRFGTGAVYSPERRFGGFPLLAPNVVWRLNGALTSNTPILFLAERFLEGFQEFGRYCHGWLLGESGDVGERRWIYIDSIVPASDQAVCPDATIGRLFNESPTKSPKWQKPYAPVNVYTETVGPVFALGEDRPQITSYFVASAGHLAEKPPPGDFPTTLEPKLVIGRPAQVGANGGRGERGSEDSENAAGPSGAEIGKLRAMGMQDPPVCPVCREAYDTADGINRCTYCGTIVHEDCFAWLGGCALVGCPSSPLQTS